MGRSLRRCVAVLAGFGLAATLLSACGGSEEEPAAKPSVAVPSGDVEVPSGVQLTKPGTELEFGEKATVAYEPNPRRGSVLELTVRSVVRGRLRDLAMYTLDDRTMASLPYYVRVSVKNVGKGDLGKTPIPLWAVDSTNTLIQASSFTNRFERCPSQPLPAGFAPNDAVNACLVYLVPRKNKFVGVSYRPLQAFAPIEWSGDVVDRAAAQKAKPGQKKNQKNQKNQSRKQKKSS